MAGIGWRLERLINQGSLAGATAAYATGGAVTALPWVLTTAVLVSLPVLIGRGAADFAIAQSVVDVAYSVALLVDGPLQIVISRHTADRLYEGRLSAIAAPFRRGLSLVLAICGSVAAGSLLALGLPPAIVLWGGALSAAAGAQWTALSVGNGLCSPELVLGAVGAGAALSFVLSGALVAVAGLGIPGYLFGLVSGQSLTLAILLVGIFRALPEGADESARLRPAFRDFAALAGAGLAFNASLWVDKLVAWRMAGGATGMLHAEASTLAWFSTIPCLAWIFVEVETRFYRRFRAFYGDLEGGAPLRDLRRGIRALSEETARLRNGAMKVQAAVIIFFELAADPWFRWLHLPAGALPPFRLLLVGAGLQALSLLGLILLYYFDRRRDALLAAAGLLSGVAALTIASSALGLPPSAGMVAGCAIGALLTWSLVDRGVKAILQHTLLGQPFGVERIGQTESLAVRAR
jgi:polysaccharide biosynthesis protein PelG